ncbi:MAG: PAS domain S-box protein [Candidatus Zixiibacteriota bacterium]
MRKFTLYIALVCIGAGFLSSALCAPEKIIITNVDETVYLPYDFRGILEGDHKVFTKPQYRPVQVITPWVSGSVTEGKFLRTYNPALNIDNPAIFSYILYPSLKLMDDSPIRLIINDWEIYQDASLKLPAVSGAGYKNDSAWAFKFVPEKDEVEKIFLTLGRDSTGDGHWDPSITLVLLEDYDFDGNHEVFISVNSMREYIPRTLFCIELETMTVEWSLPTATNLNRFSFHSCRDSLNPAVIFTSYNAKQGVVDENFDDRYGYLTIVNNRGQVVYNRIISVNHGGMTLVPDTASSDFFVTGELAPNQEIPPDTIMSGDQYWLSRIRRNGEVIKSVPLEGKPVDLWRCPYGKTPGDKIFVRLYQSVCRAYDRDLNLYAVTDTVIGLGEFRGLVKLPGRDRRSFVFSDGIYSDKFNKQLHFPFSANSFYPVELNEENQVLVMTINTANKFSLGHIERKSFWALMSLLYHQNQYSILFSLTLLALALVIVNSYRRHAIYKLNESENQLKSVYENVYDILYRIDLEGRFVWASPTSVNLLGYDHREVEGRRVTDFYIHPERWPELLSELMSKGRVSDHEVIVRHQNGQEVILSTDATCIRGKDGKLIGFEGVLRDITLRKKAELELGLAHAELEQVFNAAAPLCVIDKDYRILRVNKMYARVFKVKEEEEVGQKCYERWPCSQCHSMECPMVRILKGSERYEYEIDSVLFDGTIISSLVTAVPYRNAKREVLGIVENYTDITQRKLAEEALRLSEARYRSLVESAGEAIFTVDRDGVFLFMNSIAAAKWHKKPDELVGKTMWELFPEKVADRQVADIREVFDTGRFEIRDSVVEIDRQTFNYRTSMQPVRDSSGKIVAVLGIARDTTTDVKTRKELKSEREFVVQILETANSLVVCLDSDARIKVFNRECERITGYKREEVIGRSWPETFLPKGHRTFKKGEFARWVKQHPADSYEGVIITKSGEERTILWSNSSLFSDESDEVRALAIGHDITVKKIAERALRESEEKFREITEMAPEGIYEADLEGNLLFANKTALKYFQYTKEEFASGINALSLFVPEEQQKVLNNLEKLKAGIRTGINEYIARRKDGTTFPVNLHSSPIYRDGRIVGLRGVIIDVTEKKKNDELQLILYRITNAVNITKDINELFETIRQILGTILDTTNFYIALYDRDTNSITHAYQVDEKDDFKTFPAGKTMTMYVINNNKPLLATREVKQRLIDAGEIEVIGSPSKVWMGVPLKIHNEISGAVVVLNYDDENTYTEKDLEILKFVSEHIAIAMERKKAEDALIESEKRYALATTAAGVGVWDWNLGMNDYYIDPAIKANLGYNDVEIPNDFNIWMSHVHPDDLEKVWGTIRPDTPDKTPEFMIEHRMIHKDGSIRWIMVRGRTFYDDMGRAVRIIGTDTDITQLKAGEEALRESETRFSEVLFNSRDILYRLNLETRTYDYMSYSVKEVMGFTAEEIIAMGVEGVSKLAHPGDYERLRNHREELVNSPKTDHVACTTEYRLLDRNGNYHWLSDSHARINDKNGKPRYIIGSVRDITENKKAEQQLLESEEKSRAQYKSIPLPTYTWQCVGDNFILIDHNDKALEITEGKIVDFLGMTFSEMYPDWQECFDVMWYCYKAKTSLKKETLYKFMSTGKERLLDVNYVFVPPDLVMVHTDDITDKRRAEIKMRAVEQEKYEQAKRTAGVFAHEIRNAPFSGQRSHQPYKRLPF